MKTAAVWPLFSVAIEREDIAVGVIHQIKVPDEEWRYVDKAGHGHFWKGKKVPTCKLVVTGTTWVGDEYEAEEIEIKEWKCKLCYEIIEPGYRMQLAPTHVPGPTWVTIVINDETFVITPEQYASSVEAWRDALRDETGADPVRFDLPR